MSKHKKIRLWCPQPATERFPASFAKAPTALAAVVLVEILLLLIAPITYYALLAPKPSSSVNQTFPLTNNQVEAAWPNLPTAQELVNGGMTPVGGLAYNQDENCSVVNPFFVNGGFNGSQVMLTNPEYKIFLYYSNQTAGAGGWIQVPQSYLSTAHPPQIPPAQSGFLGTGLPPTYVAVAIAVIIVTLLACAGYLLHKKRLLKTGVGNCGFA